MAAASSRVQRLPCAELQIRTTAGPVAFGAGAVLKGFDLIELDGQDLRRDPLEVRKATLASVLAKAGPGIRLNDHIEHEDGETVLRHACKLGLEGIVSKRKDSRYRSGRSLD